MSQTGDMSLCDDWIERNLNEILLYILRSSKKYYPANVYFHDFIPESPRHMNQQISIMSNKCFITIAL